ncbi:MAG TPA: hypothetical protein VG938_13600 [Verrucomicrobiae bacterium]|jgi:hypothetical protein|nr:hypothetical protein [Verrucomicrobiae bacterium]
MIKGFESPHSTEPVEKSRWHFVPAIAAGLIAGFVLLVLPHASPWEGLTSFTPAVLGRVIPATWNVPILGVVIMHLVLSLIYGFIVSLVVINIRELRAVFIGGLVGLVLYFLNLLVVSFCLPELRGNEVSIFVTHVVFGLIAAGVYRGLLRRKVAAEP